MIINIIYTDTIILIFSLCQPKINSCKNDHSMGAGQMSGIDCFDVTIIGGGPAGLYSAFYSGLREMKTKIIEAQPQLGGKLHIYPEKMIWDVGGMPPVTGAKLMEQLVEQGQTFHPETVFNEKMGHCQLNSDSFAKPPLGL